jgi:hypothetical protein
VRSLLYLVLCLLFVSGHRANSQSLQSDTAFVAQARANAIKRHTEEVGVNSNFYNGAQYEEYSPQTNEHPYLHPDWSYGSVEYDGEFYKRVPLLFDIANDQVVSSYIHGNTFRLVNEKVGSFILKDQKFVRITDEQVPAGFYQLVYDGKTRFVIRRRKMFFTKLDGNVIRNAFDLKIEYYLVKDGKFHLVRGERSLLGSLGDHKQEVKKFMRERRIHYGSDKEKSAVSILTYYDQITN